MSNSFKKIKKLKTDYNFNDLVCLKLVAGYADAIEEYLKTPALPGSLPPTFDTFIAGLVAKAGSPPARNEAPPPESAPAPPPEPAPEEPHSPVVCSEITQSVGKIERNGKSKTPPVTPPKMQEAPQPRFEQPPSIAPRTEGTGKTEKKVYAYNLVADGDEEEINAMLGKKDVPNIDATIWDKLYALEGTDLRFRLLVVCNGTICALPQLVDSSNKVVKRLKPNSTNLFCDYTFMYNESQTIKISLTK